MKRAGEAQFYLVKPQVAGELGAKTVFASRFPSRVTTAEFLLNMWPCDALQETYPCFFASEDLVAAIVAKSFTGLDVQDCLSGFTDYVPHDEQVKRLKFHRLLLVPFDGVLDLSATDKQEMIVSARVQSFLANWKFDDCQFTPFVADTRR
jgi:hypothetical protein